MNKCLISLIALLAGIVSSLAMAANSTGTYTVNFSTSFDSLQPSSQTFFVGYQTHVYNMVPLGKFTATSTSSKKIEFSSQFPMTASSIIITPSASANTSSWITCEIQQPPSHIIMVQTATYKGYQYMAVIIFQDKFATTCEGSFTTPHKWPPPAP